jgi:hypothetical protein
MYICRHRKSGSVSWSGGGGQEGNHDRQIAVSVDRAALRPKKVKVQAVFALVRWDVGVVVDLAASSSKGCGVGSIDPRSSGLWRQPPVFTAGVGTVKQPTPFSAHGCFIQETANRTEGCITNIVSGAGGKRRCRQQVARSPHHCRFVSIGARRKCKYHL